MTGAVVVQILAWVLATRSGHHAGTAHETVHQERNLVRIRAEGFLARVLQHEIDHINGLMFIDHIKDKPNAFYKLTDEGKLEHMDGKNIQKLSIFR